MQRIVVLNTNRSEYDIRDAAAGSITVGEFIRELEHYDEDAKMVLSNDSGYTFGYISERFIEEVKVESREEEELRERMEDLQHELSELEEEYDNPLDEEKPMSEETYRQYRANLFNEYDITEEQFNHYKF